MPELRYNPLLGTYTIVAANRQQRPNLPQDYCPFCPGSGKVPEAYEVFLYANDFPALSFDAENNKEMTKQAEPYHIAPALGACDVVLYASGHNTCLWQLSVEHIGKLVALWQERDATLTAHAEVKYVFVFENRGREVGVTQHHPHGQIYAYPFLPEKIKTELENGKRYLQANGRNLWADMLETELADDRRIVFQNEHFIVYLPHFTDYPYGVFIVAKQNIVHLSQFEEAHRQSLALALKEVAGMYDALFDIPFPYMMCMHQAPVNLPEFFDCEHYFRFHIEYYPVLRDANRVKFYAGSEMGAWVAANTRLVEETALELREAHQRFLSTYASTDSAPSSAL